MENIYLTLDRYLQEGRRTVLARIIRRSGSAPRTIGTSCLIAEDSALTGTVGGGRLEFEVINAAVALFETARTRLLSFRMTGSEVAASEMLCGGTVDVYLEPVFPRDAGAKEVFSALAEWIRQGDSGVLVTRIADGIDPAGTPTRILIDAVGKTTGDLDLPADLKHRLMAGGGSGRKALIDSGTDGDAFWVEPFKPDDVLYLFGAGHVSLPVARIADMVGFRVVVIDDRDEFANRQRFPWAEDILVTPFVDVFNRIRIHSSSYIVIVTRGHAYDRDVLREALKYPAAYIGMIGSRRKIEIIYRSLKNEGLSEGQLRQVHAPIGLPIGGQTPEEIAVSIVAELIKVRTSRNGPT